MNLHRLARERSFHISLLLFGPLVPACSIETVPTEPLDSASPPGRILGLVTGDDAPVSGVTVTLSRGGAVLAMVTTTGNGEFGFNGLAAGPYTVAIPEIGGMRCNRRLVTTVVAGEAAVVSFACVTPPPPASVGTVEGRVTVNGVAARRILVTMGDANGLIGSRTTTEDGTYRFTDVPAGARSVWLYSGAPCPGTHQEEEPGRGLLRTQLEVIVSEEEVAVAEFACTGQVVTGVVTINGVAINGAKVYVCEGSPSPWDYEVWCLSNQVTDSEGRYAYTSLPGFFLQPGVYHVFAQAPSGTTCPEPLGVLVTSGVTVTVDLACVRSS